MLISMVTPQSDFIMIIHNIGHIIFAKKFLEDNKGILFESIMSMFLFAKKII